MLVLFLPEPAIVIDESMVSELMGMGFAFEGCRKAVYFTQGQGMEAAVNWIMEHMDDAGKLRSHSFIIVAHHSCFIVVHRHSNLYIHSSDVAPPQI